MIEPNSPLSKPPKATVDTVAHENPASKLAHFAMQRPIGVIMCFVTLLVFGFVASLGLRQELLPSGMTPPVMGVHIVWRDSPSREVLDKIIVPLEEELSTVSGIKVLNSNASLGRARVHITFRVKTDLSVAFREVRDRVERARVHMPDDIRQPIIWKASTDGIPVFVIGAEVDQELDGALELIEQLVVAPLERIEGVAEVNINGFGRKEIIIELDRAALEASGLNVLRVGRALRSDNFSMASGHTFQGEKKFFLRSMAKYKSIEEIENRLIGPNVRVKDVGRVKYEESDRRWSVRLNGQRAMSIEVIKEGDANAVEVAKAIENHLQKFAEDPRLQYLSMQKIFSQGDEISKAIGSLVSSGKLGALFAAFVLFFFLRRLGITLVVALSIPVSLMTGLTVMYFSGQSLNVFALLGLVVCVGLLVDNAVVVAENIFRLHSEKKLPLREACEQGVGEIALAIVMATLTTVVVFVPISLVQGKMQVLLQQLSIPIASSVLGSLLVALIFVPLAVFLVLKAKNSRTKSSLESTVRDTDEAQKEGPVQIVLRKSYDVSFSPIAHVYDKLLKFFICRRLDLVMLLMVIMGVTTYLAKKHIEFSPALGEKENQINIRFKAPASATFDDVQAYFAKMEEILIEHKEQYKLSDFLAIAQPTGGRLRLWFDKSETETLDMAKTAKEIVELFPERAGYRVRYGQLTEGDEKKRKNRRMIQLQGEDPDLLENAAEEIFPRFLQIDGVIGMLGVDDDVPREMGIVLDRDRIAAANVQSVDVATLIGNALRGAILPTFSHGGREVEMRVRFKEQDRDHISDIKSLYVMSEDREPISVDSLGEMKLLNSAERIHRRNKKLSYRAALELDEDKRKAANAAISNLIKRIDLPEGISFNRQEELQDEEVKHLMLALLFSIIFIYLLMCFLFESFILPLSIILTIPLAYLGVVIGHALTGLDMDMMSIVAAVLLVGVVVNNGIVLVDYIQRLRHAGNDRSQAIVLAVSRRFRPVMMTVLTTIIGLIPLTFAPPGAFGIDFKSFGVTLISGLSVASILTLLIVPIFYSLFDDFRSGVVAEVNSLRKLA